MSKDSSIIHNHTIKLILLIPISKLHKFERQKALFNEEF